ncbi:MAG: glycine cleavage system aminomethyltransferase GcvT [Acidimicrobiaceae bacterium]|nr:glycine cleavage system aminomethyltransferase GcvT [Acidimicrobiaceae bacterium]
MRYSPLHKLHEEAEARIVDFAGWNMPLHYKAGTLKEHLACRKDAVMFDVSHLGTVRLIGRGAFRILQWAFTNDLQRISPGRALYTHMLDPDDASVTDDIIVWWIRENHFDVMPNASNTGRVMDALATGLGAATKTSDLQIEDITSSRAIISVQGPKARERVSAIASDVAEVGRFKVAEVNFLDIPVTVAGTGYTGEDGIEIAVPAEHSTKVWQSLLEAEIQPAGLGARDTLRLEAGFPLHGHELGPGITPLQANLGWVVRFGKGDFRGRKPLEQEKTIGPQRILRGLLAENRRPPRENCIVYKNGKNVGKVTSGNFSPILGRGIALALLDAACQKDDQVVIDVRGRELNATIVKPPFHHLKI